MLKVFLLLLTPSVVLSLPTLYEYYTSDGINSGLSVDQPYFTLNGKNITIYSGAIHYFRVPRAYWSDRLRRMRSLGLNAIETYIPWNLHEPQPGVYDFGDGGTDMQDFLNITEFLEIAKSEDLLVILRPGPYICAEWEFGGFPSWLLREEGIQLRTSDTKYMQHVERYFNKLLPILSKYQFTKGGPVIAFQVENEYGSTQSSITPDKKYLEQLRTLMLNNGLVELLFTSDSPTYAGTNGTLPGTLFQTANFGGDPTADFNALQTLQPGKPLMAMEFYVLWFDHWGEDHHSELTETVAEYLEMIFKSNASVNMYMFHGGTSYGFMNGANVNNSEPNNSGYQPDTTNYDYDAPIRVQGVRSDKYYAIKGLLEKYIDVQTELPSIPPVADPHVYGTVSIQEQLPIGKVLDEQAPIVIESKEMVPMELLPINNNSGQSYGYIVYRKTLDLPANSTLKIVGYIRDTLMVLINGKLISPPLASNEDLDANFGSWRLENSSLVLTQEDLKNVTLDLIVENFGRVGYGPLKTLQSQFKGFFQGDVLINDEVLENWKIIPLEFKTNWVNNLTNWEPYDGTYNTALYRTQFNIDGDPQDTYIYTEPYTKGIVIVNGFVLGRYFLIGSPKVLYLPAPFLKSGNNEFVIFEHYGVVDILTFVYSFLYKN